MSIPATPSDLDKLVADLQALRDELVYMSQALRDMHVQVDQEGQQQARAALEELLLKLGPP